MAYEDPLVLTGQNIVDTTFEYDFYSGSQITVMIGDVFIDNAISINYQVEQTRAPVFGYASQYYSFVSDGHVMVSGALAIAFKEAGYLLAPIQRFIQLQVPGLSTSPRMYLGPGGSVERPTFEGVRTFSELSKIAQHHRNIRSNVEQSRQWRQTDDPNYNKRYYDFWNELGALPDNKFEDWAEAFEDALWYGSDTANPFTRDKLNSKNVEATGDIYDDELILNHRRADQYPAIDIWITYGDINNQSANHTVKKLMDVQFIGQSQTIQISGEPVFEVYNFIARNVV